IRHTTVGGWITLFCGIFGGVLVGKLANVAIVNISQRLATRGWRVRSIITRSLAGPANLALIGVGISIGIGHLAPSPQLFEAAGKGLGLLYIIAAGWLLYNLIDLVDSALRNITSRTETKLDDQLVPLVTKTIRIFLIVIVVLFTAENIFGANISAWLAGLGIAGLAVSLAAQDSIKNVFGSITIIIDQPFAQGDFVKVGDYSGNVEEVGFRSTRLRTPDGTLVTIPNSKVADSNIENFQARKGIRRAFDLAITCDTPPAKVEEALRIIKEVLAEPDIAASFDLQNLPPRVYFSNLAASSLNIQVMYWFTPTDFWAYNAHAEKVNLRLLQRLEQAGIEFAFPTQTLYLASDPKRKLVHTGILGNP
ncbi:MAG TPA: mechanosensitive ion channel family protein, partial [Candidatus Sulfotelmatobacter sp.]|nr:mechanosensitive ion channel family protein [Candidatus Sulfotelmatobacter sp.]